MRTEIVPAVLEKTKKDFLRAFRKVEPFAEKIQVDFQDGKFIRNKTIGPSALLGMKKEPKLDFHLMIKEPEKQLEKYLRLKPYIITFQIEGSRDVLGCIKKIKGKKVKAGIAINPETKVEDVKPFLGNVDQVLVMTVRPGRQGQKLIPSTLDKVKKLRKLKPKMNIQVDGGINKANIRKVLSSGANSIVLGSAIVKQKDAKKEMLLFKKLIGG